MSTDEEYVRSVWEYVGPIPKQGSNPLKASGLFTDPFKMTCYVFLGHHHIQPDGYDLKEEDTWSAAAEFTLERQEHVRQLREEIAWMRFEFAKRNCLNHVQCVRKRALQARILSRLESALTDLTRGMKPEAEGATR